MNSDTFYEMLTMENGAMDALRSKMPWFAQRREGAADGESDLIVHIHEEEDDEGEKKGIFLVEDNAKPHIGKTPGSSHKKNVERLGDYFQSHGLNVEVALQPAQSPDLNLLDNSLFRALSMDSHSCTRDAKSLKDILLNVTSAFDEFPADTIARSVASQFSNYREILACLGDNTYTPPHSHIRQRQAEGGNEIDFSVSFEVAKLAAQWVKDETSHFAELAREENGKMGGQSQKKKALQNKQTLWEVQEKQWIEINNFFQ